MDVLVPFQLIDDLVQLVEPFVPKPAVSLDPFGLCFEPARAELGRFNRSAWEKYLSVDGFFENGVQAALADAA